MTIHETELRSNSIPQETIRAFSRSIFKEASKYGFGKVDVIKMINELLDLCSAGVKKDVAGDLATGDESDLAAVDCRSLPLVGARLSIREYVEAQDREYLESWLSDRYGRYFVLSCATARRITLESLCQSASTHLGMITSPEGQPIGAMAFLDHSKDQERAELRKLIGDKASRGQGLAEEATRLWIRYGFQGLGLKKIYVSTLQTQIANIKLNEDIGFEVEGLLRNELLIDGQRHDVLRMGISSEEM
ncbi:MAG: GNAT family protein [Woeseiaceae bacterium]|nr:GNAT family protein [Woeseiaceae bacterium]